MTRLFRNANFRSLWLGQLVSIFGDRLQYLALLSLLVEGARDPRNPAPELALVPVVSFLPTILIGPVAGALVDGWDTRRVLAQHHLAYHLLDIGIAQLDMHCKAPLELGELRRRLQRILAGGNKQ